MFDIKNAMIATTWARLILETHKSKAQVLDSLNRLVQNVNKGSSQVTSKTIEEFFKNGGLLAFALNGQFEIVGVATLVVIRKINGDTARLEHVSVLPEFSGRRTGENMVKALVYAARELGVNRIDLTCEPSREAANHIYEKLGFGLRRTNVRRLHVK
jgi:ribosomal protein S18 acetylase RimI-like enzyme